MTIRPATAADLTAIVALEKEIFGVDAWTAASVGEELSGERRHAFVAVKESVVGYAVVMCSDDVADLQRIAVGPAHRRFGMAKGLLDEACSAARDAGAQRMLLEVSADNAAALSFYTAQGFSQIDRRPRYYRDGADALVLEAPLGRRVEGRAS